MTEAKIYTAEQIIADIEKTEGSPGKIFEGKNDIYYQSGRQREFRKNNRAYIWPRLYCSRNSSAGKSRCIQRTAFTA